MANVLILLTLPEPVRSQYRDRLRRRFPKITIELVDHQLKVARTQQGQMLGLGVEPEDQLRWRLHDRPEHNHLLIGRCWVSQSIVPSRRPAKPPIETDVSRISLRLLMTPPGSAGA